MSLSLTGCGGYTMIYATGGVLVLLLACLLSFAWSMQHFFTAPTGTSRGMRLIKVFGTGFALCQVGALFRYGALDPEHALGAATLCALSLALFWWALHTNRRTPLSAIYSTDVPQRIVHTGPYRLVRHPFYASYLLAWLACPLATGQLWLALPALFMAVVYFTAAKAEEQKFAASPLAGDYERYRACTGLFLPNPVKLMLASAPQNLAIEE